MSAKLRTWVLFVFVSATCACWISPSSTVDRIPAIWPSVRPDDSAGVASLPWLAPGASLDEPLEQPPAARPSATRVTQLSFDRFMVTFPRWFYDFRAP